MTLYLSLKRDYFRRSLDTRTSHLQGAVLVFIYDMFSFAGPVLLQQLLQSLEDRSDVGKVHPRRQSSSNASIPCASHPVESVRCEVHSMYVDCEA